MCDKLKNWKFGVSMEMPSVDGTTNNDLSINTQRMPDFATSVQYNWNSNSHIKLGAIIRSMTPKERENPQILNASRKRRIAAGCGLEVVDVNRLLKSFEMLQQMTKAMTKGKLRGLGGMMGGMPNMNRMHGFGRKKRLK